MLKRNNNVNDQQFNELISRFDKLESKVDTEISCLKDRINQTTILMLFFNGTAMLAILGSVLAPAITYHYRSLELKQTPIIQPK